VALGSYANAGGGEVARLLDDILPARPSSESSRMSSDTYLMVRLLIPFYILYLGHRDNTNFMLNRDSNCVNYKATR